MVSVMSFKMHIYTNCVSSGSVVFWSLPPLQVKYKEKYEKAKGHYLPVADTPQILHAKAVRSLVSEVRNQNRSWGHYPPKKGLYRESLFLFHKANL